MAKQFNVGDTVYFVSSSVFVRKAIVIRAAAGFVTIKFDTNNGNDGPSGIRVRESKVYHISTIAFKKQKSYSYYI